MVISIQSSLLCAGRALANADEAIPGLAVIVLAIRLLDEENAFFGTGLVKTLALSIPNQFCHCLSP